MASRRHPQRTSRQPFVQAGWPFALDAPWGSLFRPLITGAFKHADRAWDELERAARNGEAIPRNASFYYESTTQTTGVDGRTHRETVRTTPDKDGRLQTVRVVKGADGREIVRQTKTKVPPSPFKTGALFADFGAPFMTDVVDREERRVVKKQGGKGHAGKKRIGSGR